MSVGGHDSRERRVRQGEEASGLRMRQGEEAGGRRNECVGGHDSKERRVQHKKGEVPEERATTTS